MKRAPLFLATMLICTFATSCYSLEPKHVDIKHYKVEESTKCDENRLLKNSLPDYLMYGFTGTECISNNSYLDISGDSITEIIVSKNPYSDESLNAYDLKITFGVNGKEGQPSAAQAQGQCAVYIGDYLLGVFDAYDTPSGNTAHFLIIDTNTEELIAQLNKLNTDVKVQLISE